MSRTVSPPDSPPRAGAYSPAPVWRTYGGGGLIVGGVALLAATIIEWIWIAQGEADARLLLIYGVVFVAALTVLAGSVVALAFGASGRDGVVRGSVVGRAGLVGYGALFLVSQAAQLLERFAGAEEMAMVSLLLSVLQIACGLVAAVIAARAGVLHGFARIALLLSVSVGLIAGIVADSGAPVAAVMTGFCASAASIVVVGAAYAAQRPRARRQGLAS